MMKWFFEDSYGFIWEIIEWEVGVLFCRCFDILGCFFCGRDICVFVDFFFFWFVKEDLIILLDIFIVLFY